MNNSKYHEEVSSKWGNTSSYKEYQEKTKSYNQDKWNELTKNMNEIFSKFSICLINNEKVDSETVFNLVKKLQNYITKNFYNCNKEMLLSLGKMYVEDERFKKNIDKDYPGTAEYIFMAITCYYHSKQEVD